MIYLHTLAGLLDILLAIYVLKNNPAKKSNRLFSATAFISGLWTLSNTLMFTGYRFVYPWVYLNFALGAMIPPFILHWTIEFTRYKFNRTYIFVAYLFSFILFLFALTPGFVIRDYFVPDAIGYGFKIFLGKIFVPYALCISIILLIALFILLRKRNKSFGLEKLQLNYALLGFGIPAILVIILDFFLPLFGNTHYGNIDSLTSFIFIGIIAYSITRYRFLDIKVIIRKGVVYGLSIIIALAFYTYLAILLKDYLQNTLNLSENWGIFVLILLVALGFPPLKYGVEKLITTAFFPKVKNLKKKAREIAQDISSKIKLEELVNRFASEVKENISAHTLQVYLKNRKTGDFNAVYPTGFSDLIKYDHLLTNYFKINQEILITEEIEYMKENENEAKAKLLEKLKKELEKRHIALVIPLQNLSEELDVLIFLESKKNKEAFNLEDISFLQNISSQFNIALANAILYKEAVERISR